MCYLEFEDIITHIECLDVDILSIENIRSNNLPVEQIWVNLDCSLKTRRWSEVIPSIKNMVDAAKMLREVAGVNQ